MTTKENKEKTFFLDCLQTANRTEKQFGPHPSREFAACRIAEEAGEMVQAMTSVSRDRAKWSLEYRRERARSEAVDVVAMVLRALREL